MAGKGGCPLLMDRNHESKTKKVDGEAHPASDFAMTSDYRGNPVEIPEGDRRAVMKKILARKAKLEQEES